MKTTVSFFLLVLISFGCSKDSPSSLSPVIIPVAKITYSNTVKAIIDNNCISCHAAVPINFAPMSLTTYENVKEAIQNRGLINRISRDQGASGMMPSGGTRLPQTSIDAIVKWQTDGLTQ
ncbi:cytochrome c [Flavobacterium sp.]|uniref:c-type cytochrome n=1 Tax=Flavobacterium sp. TaxID=239 RepID=UPI00286E08C3|nr:cytochrome c [Flavobacterium sp.]